MAAFKAGPAKGKEVLFCPFPKNGLFVHKIAGTGEALLQANIAL